MKERQDVFNGFGAQESCDCLFTALIHPLMPTVFVCKSNQLWARFRSTVIEQHNFRVDRVLNPKHLKLTPLPYLSGPDPFRMNTNAHQLYTAGIPCYRRALVKVSVDRLTLAHSMGLFEKDAVLGEDGIAKGKDWLLIYSIFTSTLTLCSSSSTLFPSTS